MDRLLAFPARLFVGLLQALPLRWVAHLGRAGGQAAWWIDRRHRRVALANLARSFPELSPDRIRQLAAENFRRLGESYACGIKTASLTPEQLRRHVEFLGVEKLVPPGRPPEGRSMVVAIGHFGNFELYARFGQFVPGIQCATTYRGLRQPALNRVLQSLRERSGCRFFERRKDGAALKAAMAQEPIFLGLLADQHAGDRGLRLPFLGRECSTSPAPAIFALRYQCPLFTAICYRIDLAQWQVEIGEEIPVLDAQGHPRPVRDIMREVNTAYEMAIRRDPTNWFWVHQRWKPGPANRNTVAPDPAATAVP